MSIESLLNSIDVKLNYHKDEYRALSEAAQRDLYAIHREVKYALGVVKANGVDGLQQPVRPTKLRARAKLKTKKKTK
ncbi:hypothetical protein LCGC14_1799850 [marine sediment metagenome]|uniref:Uncharacterized protein n=1 Tax=marine sediment metagenome TaxID=412755 RepID=A0A0F9JPL1_9ZZZZ